MDLTRKISVDILSAFDTNNDRLPKIIDKYIKKYEASSSQKKRCKASINEIIRHRGIIDHIIEDSSSRKMKNIQPQLKSILRLGCYDLLFDVGLVAKAHPVCLGVHVVVILALQIAEE